MENQTPLAAQKHENHKNWVRSMDKYSMRDDLRYKLSARKPVFKNSFNYFPIKDIFHTDQLAPT